MAKHDRLKAINKEPDVDRMDPRLFEGDIKTKVTFNEGKQNKLSAAAILFDDGTHTRGFKLNGLRHTSPEEARPPLSKMDSLDTGNVVPKPPQMKNSMSLEGINHNLGNRAQT